MFLDPCVDFATPCNHGYCEVQDNGDPHCKCFDGWEDQGQDKCNQKSDPEPTDKPTTQAPTDKPTTQEEPTDKPTTQAPPTSGPPPNPCDDFDTADCDGNHMTGECIVSQGQAKCECKSGWKGNNCNVPDN